MANTHYGPWTDIKGYTSVTVTVDASTSNSDDVDPPCWVLWGTGTDDNPPRDVSGDDADNEIDVLVSDRFPLMGSHEKISTQFDARTRWVRIKAVTMSGLNTMHIATTYKVAPTELRVRDDQAANVGDLVKINNNAMQIILTDTSSSHLTVTDDNSNSNRALYTHLADSSGASLDVQTNNTLAVAIRDSANTAIETLGSVGNMTMDDADTGNFPPSDIVFLVSRAYSMAGAAPSSNNRHLFAYKMIQDFQTLLKTKNPYTNTRVSVVTYARPDISCATEHVDVAFITDTSVIGDTDASIYRTFRPGAIEFVSDNEAIIDTNLGQLVQSATLSEFAFDYSTPTDTSVYHHSHDDKFIYTPNTIQKIPVMQPGNNVYTTIDKLFNSNGSMGNHIRHPSLTMNRGTDSSIALLSGKKAVLINIADASFTDDLQISTGITNQALRDGSVGRLTNMYNSAQNKLKTLFGENIYSIILNSGTVDEGTKHTHQKFVDPCNTTIQAQGTFSDTVYQTKLISATNTHNEGARILTLDLGAANDVTATASMGVLFDTIFEAEYIGANSTKAVITDLSGVEQASTAAIEGAVFGGRALYYSLTDKNGKQYKTTQNVIDVETSTNAMHVHLTDTPGNSITPANELPVYFVADLQKTIVPFDTIAEASMTVVTDVCDHSFQLRHIGIANEFPITVWLKIYDISAGANVDSTSFTAHTDSLVYNIPVPGGSYRDIHMTEGVPFSNGLHIRISPDFPYDNSYVYLGPDSGRVYVLGSYSDLVAN